MCVCVCVLGEKKKTPCVFLRIYSSSGFFITLRERVRLRESEAGRRERERERERIRERETKNPRKEKKARVFLLSFFPFCQHESPLLRCLIWEMDGAARLICCVSNSAEKQERVDFRPREGKKERKKQRASERASK